MRSHQQQQPPDNLVGLVETYSRSVGLMSQTRFLMNREAAFDEAILAAVVFPATRHENIYIHITHDPQLRPVPSTTIPPPRRNIYHARRPLALKRTFRRTYVALESFLPSCPQACCFPETRVLNAIAPRFCTSADGWNRRVQARYITHHGMACIIKRNPNRLAPQLGLCSLIFYQVRSSCQDQYTPTFKNRMLASAARMQSEGSEPLSQGVDNNTTGTFTISPSLPLADPNQATPNLVSTTLSIILQPNAGPIKMLLCLNTIHRLGVLVEIEECYCLSTHQSRQRLVNFAEYSLAMGVSARRLHKYERVHQAGIITQLSHSIEDIDLSGTGQQIFTTTIKPAVMSGYPYGYSGYGQSSSSSRYPARTVSPLGQSRFEGSSRYHSSSRTFEVRPQPDFSRRESELAQLSRTQTITGPTPRSSTRRPSDNYGSSGIDISSYGGGSYNPYAPSSSYNAYRSPESSSSSFRDVNYQQASSTYRDSPSSSSYGRGYMSASSRPSDIYVPDSLRIGRSDARYDDRYFSSSSASAGYGSYSTRDITPSSSSGLRRSDAQRPRLEMPRTRTRLTFHWRLSTRFRFSCSEFCFREAVSTTDLSTFP
ncbi:uncharacterized protein MYCFIDRAFT_171831 [Pseudocercospora fijiensis CIRAD86]|uniref:Uncharacterized protein n=1 Tax=Pseudocercospora fijiensis (strain CIRAD86) TaxID=383855 RepID=M3B9K2_PSEFD|nr:uncharacterized protein MYCFIDRAFT_171831 [Pseudocercospora fijiensis CIRAD86]EME86007.1 hypothetical protein MYCFIDRAFT_171831 [Pseudocercospora fijiensis CIRAD86]